MLSVNITLTHWIEIIDCIFEDHIDKVGVEFLPKNTEVQNGVG